MSTKTKKASVRIATRDEKNIQKASPFLGDLRPALFLLLYILVDFVPPLGSADVMATQWLYLAVLDLLCVGYFVLDKKETHSEAIRPVSESLLSILYISLFVLSGVSILVAINKIESLVCYARFIVTIVAYFNLALLLYKRLYLFRLLAQVLSVVLLVQSIGVLSQFYKGYGEVDLNQLILGLKGNAGNKNILAASLVIKLPFAFYCIYSFKPWGKALGILTVTVAAFAIVILNARASYLSLFLITALYLIFCLVQSAPLYRKETLQKIAYVLIPTILAFVLSGLVLKNAAGLQDKASYFGNLGERLSTINIDTDGSGHRQPLWNSAIDYIKHHPLMGAGYGNWKLASLPYERTFSKDFEVTYHAHNDFLEAGAELGLAGTLLLLTIFICAAFYITKTLRSQKRNEMSLISVVSFMALSVYFIDAFFNFPNERPIMQFFLALILALIITAHLQSKNPAEKANRPSTKRGFVILSVLLLLPAIWLTHTTYRSMKAQYAINSDVQLDKPQKTFEEANRELPSIPNLNIFSLPIDAIKANYLFAEKKYDQALVLLNKSKAANPYLPYDDLIKAKIYSETNKMDSALFYARTAFNKRPKSGAIFQALNSISFKLKDTATLHHTFNTFTSYRNEAWAWNEYLNYLYDLPHDAKKMRALIDSSLKLFPDDTYLQHKKNFLELKK
jgi:O-antigen ligase